ncbi:MAG: diacylglycerol kinase family lipid kinase [Ardenticatenaceae bacterium]|nr:diacylglycerol kinase family lipid kinase [Ardenticatenaceae bacterium]
MTISHFFIIVNPAANRGGAARAWRQAQTVLNRAGADYEPVFTDRPGHAEVLAANAAAAGWPAVVAVGGDGTINEVVNGLVRAADGEPTTPLGIISLGSGNDSVRLLDLPRQRPVAAARRLLAARARTIDVGRVGERYFLNGVGTGFDARVAIEAQQVQRLRGMAIYLWALLKALRAHRAPLIRVVLDGQEVAARRLTLVAVTNGACYGGGFWICPDARVDDGLLDICIADELSVPGILGFVPRVMRGAHVGRPAVHMYRARQIHLSSPEPLPVHVDGEILTGGAQELTFELLPHRLTVLA